MEDKLPSGPRNAFERAMARLETQPVEQKIGAVRFALGSVFIFLGCLCSSTAGYFFCFLLFGGFCITFNIGTPDPDPALIGVFAFWKALMMGFVASFFIVLGTVILKRRWWHHVPGESSEL